MKRTPPVPTSPGNDPSSPESKTDDANESEGIDVTKDGTKLTSDRPEEPVEDDSGSASSGAEESADRSNDGQSKTESRDAEVNILKSDGWSKPSATPPNLNVIVLLEGANLETVRVPGRTTGLALLNSGDHQHILKKTKRDEMTTRPDILHQCLLTLTDSPLNKAGKLKVYLRSAKNVLIEIHRQTRIPRTVHRLYGLIVELLQKYKARGDIGVVSIAQGDSQLYHKPPAC